MKGWSSCLFPKAAAQAEQQQEQGGGGAAAAVGGKRKTEANLHSTDLWDLPGGATGEECFEIVRAKTLAKRAKESQSAAKKVARAQARKERHASANELGADLCAKLTSEEDIKKLKVPELKAVLTYKGVPIDNKSKKADLIELLAREMDGRYGSLVDAVVRDSAAAGPSVVSEPTAADFVDSSDGESDSGSSEWAYSQADDD